MPVLIGKDRLNNLSPNGNRAVWGGTEIVDGEVYAVPGAGLLLRAWVLPNRDAMPHAWDDWGLTPSGYGRRLNLLARQAKKEQGLVGLAEVWLHTPLKVAEAPEAVEYAVENWEGRIAFWTDGGLEFTKWGAADLR